MREERGLGGVLEIGFPRVGGSLQLRAGSSSVEFADGSTSSEPYAGFGFYKGF